MSKKIAQQEIASQVEADSKTVPEKRERRSGIYFTAKRIASTATFAAIAIVCKLIGKTLMLTPSFTVSFIYIPWLIAGAYLGPICGPIVGLVSDLIGNTIFGTPLIPLTVVSNTLFPLPIALIFRFAKKGNVYIKTICGSVASLVVCTLGIGSLALYTAYGYSESMNFFEYLIAFRSPQVGVLAVNITVLCLLVAPLQRVGLYPKSGESDGALAFAVGIVVSYALYAAAMITITAQQLGNAPAYVILSAAYALVTLLLVLSRSGGGLRVALIILAAAAALTIALTATITAGITYWLKYILSAAAVLFVAALTAAALVAQKRRARRKKI